MLDFSPAVLPAARSRYRRLVLAAPGAVYLATQSVGLLLLAWMADANDRGFSFMPWDGDWYLAVAEHGYDVPDTMRDASGNHTEFTAMAFFPGYPLLVRLFAVVFGGNLVVAAVVISVVSGVIAAYGVARLARHLTGSRRAGLIAVVLFAAAPMSVVYSLAYPEALLCALTAWALVGVLERRWLLAGFCAEAAGLVRPSAVVIIGVVFAAAVWEVWRSRSWRALSAMIVAPLGLALYLGWVAIRTGDPAGYTAIQQQGWGLEFDWGVETARWTLDTVLSDSGLWGPLTVGLMAAAVLLLIAQAGRLPWPLWAYACLIVVLTVGTSGVMSSKPRQLLPAVLVLLVPVAVALARRSARTMTVTVAGFVVVGLWVSAYSLSVWQYAI